MQNDTPPTQPAPPAAPAPDAGFFGWLRGLGIVREPGWLGGVAAGLAARIGIDPIIVRGIIVVLGVLGAPVLFLYAVAWLLLPDTTGRIHLQEVLRGTFDRAIAGIALMVILSALPFGGGWPWWGFGDGPWSFGGWISTMVWTVILVGAGIWLIVWLATRPSTRATTPGAAGAPGTPAAPGNSAADHTATDATAFAAASAPTTTSAPTGATPVPRQRRHRTGSASGTAIDGRRRGTRLVARAAGPVAPRARRMASTAGRRHPRGAAAEARGGSSPPAGGGGGAQTASIARRRSAPVRARPSP
jgi:phage shock protein PspC (stress-responsive transcriptional regulator)